jgi:hypothetical protein
MSTMLGALIALSISATITFVAHYTSPAAREADRLRIARARQR